MTVTFRPLAEVPGVGRIKIGLAGPSRSGKTYSAIRIAIGLAGGDQAGVYMIDTEGTAGIYKATFPGIRVAHLSPPYSYERYQETIDAAAAAGAKVIIVDSMSHAHEGPGGLLEQHDAELDRMAGQDFGKRERVKFAAWIKPKAAFTTFCNRQAQAGPHMVFCFRAKEKLKLVRGQNGKQEPVPMGWQPICTEGIEFEMTVMFVLPPNSNGVPDLEAEAAGLRDPIDKMVKEGAQFSEGFGKMLADWANADGQKPAASGGGGGGGIFRSQATEEPALTVAEREADKGTASMQAWWTGPGKPYQRELKDHLPALRKRAAAADAQPEVPFDDGQPPKQPVSLNESRYREVMAKLEAAGTDSRSVDRVVKDMGNVLKMLHDEAPELYEAVMDDVRRRQEGIG